MENSNSHPSLEADKGPASPQEDNSDSRTTQETDNEPASPEEEKEVFRSRILELFSKRLKQVRKNRKLTQEEVAGFLDSSNSLICNYEKGKQEPGIVAATILASKLGVTLDWLCGLDKNGKIQEQRTIWNEIPFTNACLIVMRRFATEIEISKDLKTVTVKFSPGEDYAFGPPNKFIYFAKFMDELSAILRLYSGRGEYSSGNELTAIAQDLSDEYKTHLEPRQRRKITAAETH